jgi:hypothetical protein
MKNPLVPQWEGILAYAALLGAIGALLHWGFGPRDAEVAAIVVVLAQLSPSLALKQAPTPLVPPPLSGDVSILKAAEITVEKKEV